MSMITILYFARLREAFGLASERLALPEGTVSADTLLDLLRARGEPWSAELAAGRPFRLAVNQDMARADTPVRDGDEVAIFPPVTGG
jgi:molybdopterin synthase sulfur carrier subunit